MTTATILALVIFLGLWVWLGFEIYNAPRFNEDEVLENLGRKNNHQCDKEEDVK